MQKPIKRIFIFINRYKKEGALILYPFLVFLLYSIFSINNTKQFIKENISVAISCAIIFSLFQLIKNNKKTALTLLYLFFALGIFIKISFYILYGTKFSSSAVFIIFETNLFEAYDFLEFYMNSKLILLLISLLLPLVVLPFFKWENTVYRNSRILKLFFISVIISSGILIFKKFKTEHILSIAMHSYQDYRIVKKQMAFDFSENISPNIQNIKRSAELNQEEIHIVVIGESTTTWHMQLYGYHKETNPLLTEIRDELFIFDSVISPHTHTILSLEKMLSYSNYENQKPERNASIVQLANQAGFTSYWISNQRPIGFHESVATNIAKAAHKKYFVTSDEYGTQEVMDEAILPVLDQVLNEPAQKKVVFIQLIGTHSPYYKRYPTEFAKFDNDIDDLLFPSKNAQKIRNQYDNAVLYNDFIIRSFIEKLRNTNTYSSLVYFSDHGEDVFDTMDFVGHNEYHATRPMYEIPFLIWLSEHSNNNFFIPSEFLKRRYNAEDFIHSFADLLSIDFDEKESTRSLINLDYKKRIRWIKENIDYDNQ